MDKSNLNNLSWMLLSTVWEGSCLTWRQSPRRRRTPRWRWQIYLVFLDIFLDISTFEYLKFRFWIVLLLKVTTLRAAISYISGLQSLLADCEAGLVDPSQFQVRKWGENWGIYVKKFSLLMCQSLKVFPVNFHSEIPSLSKFNMSECTQMFLF